MIFTEKKITINNNECKIDSPVVLYRGDYNVEVRFTIVSSPYKYSNKQETNVIEQTEASYGQLVIKTPNNNAPIFSEITATKIGAITFTITAEMIDEISEVGDYTFQIRLLDENKESRVTIPEVINGIEIREPIALDNVSTTNEVDAATVGYALTTAGIQEDTFDTQGNYNKTTWGTGDRITAAKLNKIEAGIDGVNKKVASGGTGGAGLTDEQVQQLNTAYQHSQTVHVQASDIPTKTSDLTNDSDYVNSTYVQNKIAEAQLGGSGGGTGTGTGTDVSSGTRPWANYKWACIGDSLTDSTINANTKYHEIIANETGIIVQELAKGGTGYTAGYDSSSTFYDRIANIDEDTDIVTLFGSVNDWKNNEHNTLCPQIGTANDVYDDSQTVIQNTFCANLNKTFDALFAKVPTAQVIVFGAMPYYGVNDTYFDNVRKALIDVCAKRHIPYVDMFDATGFYRIMDNAAYATAYTTDFTGTNYDTQKSFGHPNNEAHRKIIAPKFYAKLKEYLPITHEVQSGGGTTPVLCTGVSLDANSLTFETNATQTLHATFTPSNTTESKVWSSDSPSIARVANGVVTPVSNGSCNITITCGNFSATCSVTVNIAEEPGGGEEPGSGGDSGSTPDFVNYAYNTDTYTNPTTTNLPQKNGYYFMYKMNKSVSNGVLTMTKQEGLAENVDSYALFRMGIADNNKYYYRALLRTASQGVKAGVNGDTKSIPADNEWHLVSYITVDESTTGNAFAIDFVNAQVDGPVELKEFMKINLTEIYGAGEEPDKATCDATFTTYKTGLIG